MWLWIPLAQGSALGGQGVPSPSRPRERSRSSAVSQSRSGQLLLALRNLTGTSPVAACRTSASGGVIPSLRSSPTCPSRGTPVAGSGHARAPEADHPARAVRRGRRTTGGHEVIASRLGRVPGKRGRLRQIGVLVSFARRSAASAASSRAARTSSGVVISQAAGITCRTQCGGEVVEGGDDQLGRGPANGAAREAKYPDMRAVRPSAANRSDASARNRSSRAPAPDASRLARRLAHDHGASSECPIPDRSVSETTRNRVDDEEPGTQVGRPREGEGRSWGDPADSPGAHRHGRQGDDRHGLDGTPPVARLKASRSRLQ